MHYTPPAHSTIKLPLHHGYAIQKGVTLKGGDEEVAVGSWCTRKLEKTGAEP